MGTPHATGMNHYFFRFGLNSTYENIFGFCWIWPNFANKISHLNVKHSGLIRSTMFEMENAHFPMMLTLIECENK